MVQANISELKNNLSSYVAQVRAGETVLVLDRQTPVARIIPLEGQAAPLIREASAPAEHLLRRSPVHLKKPVSVEELLRQDRDQR